MASYLDDVGTRAERLKPIPFQPIEEGQCLQHAVAALLRLPVNWLPERLQLEDAMDWFRKVEKSVGVEFEYVHPDDGLPANHETWVAIIPSSLLPNKTHAVVVHRGHITVDPDDGRRAGQRLDPTQVRAALRVKRHYGEVALKGGHCHA